MTKQIDYIVEIEVKITRRLVWAAIKCIFQRKDLRITHTFDRNPFIKPKGKMSKSEKLYRKKAAACKKKDQYINPTIALRS